MKTKVLLYIGLLGLLFPKPAYAYLDPGTGSYVFQLLIALLLASTFFIKNIVKTVKEFVLNLFDRKSPDADDETRS